MKPIFDNRAIVGYARTAKQAERVVKTLLQTIPQGWKVTVRARNIDIVDLPAGWIYSVHP